MIVSYGHKLQIRANPNRSLWNIKMTYYWLCVINRIKSFFFFQSTLPSHSQWYNNLSFVIHVVTNSTYEVTSGKRKKNDIKMLVNKGTCNLTSYSLSNGLSYMNNLFCRHRMKECDSRKIIITRIYNDGANFISICSLE